MKKILFFITLILVVYIFLKPDKPAHLSDGMKSEIIHKENPEFMEARQLLDEISWSNNAIKSILCNDVSIKFSSNGISGNLSGELAYKKERDFRLLVNSIMGREMDIGSNTKHFWFWSKRMKPSALHYALHTDLHKSMLKTPLNPEWLMGALAIGSIELENSRINRLKDGRLLILQNKTDTLNRPVTKVTLIHPVRKTIMGHYLYDASGKLEASAEIIEHQTVGNKLIPKKILILWYTEGIRMEWILNNPKINVEMQPEVFQMPDINPKVNMGNN